MSPLTSSAAISLLAALPLVEQLSSTERDQLLALFEERQLQEGEVVVEAGAVCHELFFITQGVLRVTGRAAHGREVTQSFRQTGQFCTLLTSFEQQQPASQRLLAASPAQVLVTTRTQLTGLSQQLAQLPRLLTELIRRELQAKLDLHRRYLGQPAAGRYAVLLAHQPQVAQQVAQHLLASYLGITPQSLSRLRRQLT